jgi:hypothetical protein
MKTLSEYIKEVATEEIGVREIGFTNRGERVQQYQASTNLKGTGWPYCAAFICFVVREAMARWEKEHGKKLTFKRPQTAAAYGFDEWSQAQDASTKTRRKHTGEAIGIFSLHSTSHCGIAISKPDKNGFFLTIEGNSNTKGSRDGGGVVRQRRNVSNVRDWITFTV